MNSYIENKQKRRENKKTERRHATPDEVIFIFEKILEGWKTIKIYNTIIQSNPKSTISKKNVENISTGNSKVYINELTEERYKYYNDLRQKVYEYHKNIKLLKKGIITSTETEIETKTEINVD